MSRLVVCFAIASLLSLCCSRKVAAQEETNLHYGKFLYCEFVTSLSDSIGIGRVDLILRIPYDFLVFERDWKANSDSLFHGHLDVSVNLSKAAVSVGSVNFSAKLTVQDYSETSRRDQSFLLHRTLYLEPGDYSALIVVSDRNSSRSSTVQRSCTVALYNEQSLGIPVVVNVDSLGRLHNVYGYSGFLPFAEDAILAIPSEEGRKTKWYASLQRRNRGKEILFDEQLQPLVVVRAGALRQSEGKVNDFRFHECVNCIGQYTLLRLPTEKADTGPYTIRIVSDQGETQDTVSIETEIFWQNMPFSLRDINFAVDAMRHILTVQQLKQMKDGDESYMRQQFRLYWAERDPTPGTAYNELMAEYFKRVDSAYYKFQTLFEANGIITDRGKVYILYGAPEDTERVFRSDEASVEVWSYPSLNKTFRFVDRQRNGNFRLMEE